MRKRSNKRFSTWLPYAMVLVVGVLVVVMTLVLTAPADHGPFDPNKTESAEEEATVAALDAAKINALVEAYYTAKAENDAESLNRIVETANPYSVSDLTDETQYIARYEDFRTYVKPGPSEEYFIVYVTYDIYFTGIHTGAPAMNRFVVHKTEDGVYRIYDKTLNNTLQGAVARCDALSDVETLRREVESELAASRLKDHDLNELIQLLLETEEDVTTEEAKTESAEGSLEADTDEASLTEDEEETEDTHN